MALSALTRNRLGFIVLGLTNNFAYVIMLSAAYDLLKSTSSNTSSPTSELNGNSATMSTTPINATNQQIDNAEQHYCNEHSTSTILLADTLPSLTTKIIYPFLLVGLPNAGKASATAFLSAISFIITGLSKSQVMIFVGVVCASFSSGLGESCFLSSTPQYGDVSLYGWSMGTGAAGLLGAISYALLRIVLPVEPIMMIMLVVPVAMMFAFFQVIEPIKENSENPIGPSHIGGALPSSADENNEASLSIISRGVDSQEREGISLLRSYGSQDATTTAAQQQEQQQEQQQTVDSSQDKSLDNTPFDFHAKLRCLPSLAKYFLPLLLVYFAEYFINQGLFELVYYPEISFLNHAAQYRWFQVSYQLGVMISRSSLDCIQIRNLWLMSILQAVNAIIFLLHAMKAIHIPSFYIVIALIIYEGLLGGFTYVNTFYRIKKEVRTERKEFCISTVTIADSLGIVMAGLVALPVHNALCKLYS